MSVYYNEFDKFAAQTLRNLIAAGHIAPGYVDERSIEDVRPQDLAGFTQCHFFAGVGVWSYALRKANWPDDRPVWTGSCPCQPFSAAGQGAGFTDERHLWPAFHHLIAQCRPATVFGEQVASKDAGAWIDLVHTDMETLDYAFGSIPFSSAGVGAPHIRDRLYWVAHTDDKELERRFILPECTDQRAVGSNCLACGVEHPGQHHDTGEIQTTCTREQEAQRPSNITGRSSVPPSGVGDTHSERTRWISGSVRETFDRKDRQHCTDNVGTSGATVEEPCATNGLWRNADWLLCRDGKWRPVEPCTFPLVDGAPARVGRLRAYGNANNAEAAEAVIRSYMECRP